MAEAANILVVDEAGASRDALAGVLAARGWSVAVSHTGEQAIGQIQSGAVDVVIADLDGGGEWVRRMQALRPDIRVVATTSRSAPDEVACALREHVFSLFGKPFSPGAVADMAGRALASPGWRDDVQTLSASPQWIALSVRCKLEAVERVVPLLRELGGPLSSARRDDLAAGLRELLLNAIEHGGGSDPQKRIRVSAIRTARAVLFQIQDPGPGFSLHDLAHAAVANPPDEPLRHIELREESGVRAGGFGILVARGMADELIYNEKGNEVLFLKYLAE